MSHVARKAWQRAYIKAFRPMTLPGQLWPCLPASASAAVWIQLLTTRPAALVIFSVHLTGRFLLLYFIRYINIKRVKYQVSVR